MAERHSPLGTYHRALVPDDSVLGFEYEADGQAVPIRICVVGEAFPRRAHSEKTRSSVGRYATLTARKRGQGKPETVTFWIYMIAGTNECAGFPASAKDPDVIA